MKTWYLAGALSVPAVLCVVAALQAFLPVLALHSYWAQSLGIMKERGRLQKRGAGLGGRRQGEPEMGGRVQKWALWGGLVCSVPSLAVAPDRPRSSGTPEARGTRAPRSWFLNFASSNREQSSWRRGLHLGQGGNTGRVLDAGSEAYTGTGHQRLQASPEGAAAGQGPVGEDRTGRDPGSDVHLHTTW